MTPTGLYARRKAKKMTQEQLARALKVTSRTIRRWESGESPVPHWVPALLARNQREPAGE